MQLSVFILQFWHCDYTDVDDNCFANARFLDLKETVGDGGDCKVSKVMFELAAETSLRKTVKYLNDAKEKQGIVIVIVIVIVTVIVIVIVIVIMHTIITIITIIMIVIVFIIAIIGISIISIIVIIIVIII